MKTIHFNTIAMEFARVVANSTVEIKVSAKIAIDPLKALALISFTLVVTVGFATTTFAQSLIAAPSIRRS